MFNFFNKEGKVKMTFGGEKGNVSDSVNYFSRAIFFLTTSST